MTLVELINSGYLDEYRPQRHPIASVAKEDEDYCRESDCPECGHHGRSYRPFVKPLGETSSGGIITYLFYAVCPHCNYADEI